MVRQLSVVVRKSYLYDLIYFIVNYLTKCKIRNTKYGLMDIKVFTVSELSGQIKSLLEFQFAEIWLEGEISNFKAHSSGHFYFTLKDEKSQIPAVMFRGDNQRLRFQLEDGLKVLCRGRVTVYEPQGRYQIVVQEVEPVGIGSLQLLFEQLKERLEKEGLFDPKYKKPLPDLPKTVGIVTSPTGAAIQDFLKIAGRRFPGHHVVIYPSRVQGAGAAEEIVSGISALDQAPDVEVIVVTRGGGSLEDLWPFNEEIVARAIFEAKTPVVSAVGHEIDFSISDFVADLRAPTPSAAAEIIFPKKEDLHGVIDQLGGRLIRAIRLDTLKQRIDDLELRIAKSMRHLIDLRKAKFERLSGLLGALSPLAVLGRGYSIITQMVDSVEKVVTDSDQVRSGQEVSARLARGRLFCKVLDLEK